MEEQHIGSTDYEIDRPSMKPKSDAYKLSLQGWLDEQCARLSKAESALMHAEAITGYDAINGERIEAEDTPAFWDVRDFVRIAMQLQGLSLDRITEIEWIGSWE